MSETVAAVLSIITGPVAVTVLPELSSTLTAPLISPVPAVSVIADWATLAVIPVGQVSFINICPSAELDEVLDPPVKYLAAVVPEYFI